MAGYGDLEEAEAAVRPMYGALGSLEFWLAAFLARHCSTAPSPEHRNRSWRRNPTRRAEMVQVYRGVPADLAPRFAAAHWLEPGSRRRYRCCARLPAHRQSRKATVCSQDSEPLGRLSARQISSFVMAPTRVPRLHRLTLVPARLPRRAPDLQAMNVVTLSRSTNSSPCYCRPTSGLRRTSSGSHERKETVPA